MTAQRIQRAQSRYIRVSGRTLSDWQVDTLPKPRTMAIEFIRDCARFPSRRAECCMSENAEKRLDLMLDQPASMGEVRRLMERPGLNGRSPIDAGRGLSPVSGSICKVTVDLTRQGPGHLRRPGNWPKDS